MIDGQKVRALREERGLTLRTLAAMTSDIHGKTISFQAIGQIEAGEYEPNVARTAALAAALGVGIGDILTPLESAVA